jgi:hypothetical protein
MLVITSVINFSCKKENPVNENSFYEGAGNATVIDKPFPAKSGFLNVRGGGGSNTGFPDTISSSFNCTPIPAGDYIWFNAHMHVSGLTTDPATFFVVDQHVSFTNNGVLYDIPIANSTINYSAAYSTVSYLYDPLTGWTINVPFDYTGDVFFAGISYQSPGLSGCIDPVNWQGVFTSDQPLVDVYWQWGASVYTHFSQNYNDLGLELVNGCYRVGSPTKYKCYVVPGARGNGGSNLTGNFTGYDHILIP